MRDNNSLILLHMGLAIIKLLVGTQCISFIYRGLNPHTFTPSMLGQYEIRVRIDPCEKKATLQMKRD